MCQAVKTDLINRLEKFDIINVRNIKNHIHEATEDDITIQVLAQQKLIQDLRRIMIIIDQAEEMYVYKDLTTMAVIVLSQHQNKR